MATALILNQSIITIDMEHFNTRPPLHNGHISISFSDTAMDKDKVDRLKTALQNIEGVFDLPDVASPRLLMVGTIAPTDINKVTSQVLGTLLEQGYLTGPEMTQAYKELGLTPAITKTNPRSTPPRN